MKYLIYFETIKFDFGREKKTTIKFGIVYQIYLNFKLYFKMLVIILIQISLMF